MADFDGLLLLDAKLRISLAAGAIALFAGAYLSGQFVSAGDSVLVGTAVGVLTFAASFVTLA